MTLSEQYQEKIATLNSCWRTKNRAQLVSNLQQENRQIISLEEENRQLKFALKEFEDGMHMVMADYRNVIINFMRTDTLANLADKLQKNVQIICILIQNWYYRYLIRYI